MAEKSAGTNEVLAHGRKNYAWDGTNWRPILANTAGEISSAPIIKTIQTPLYAAASLAASTQALSSTISFLPSVKKATFLISHGRAATAAFTTNGTEYRVEVSAASSGNDQWLPIASVLAASAVAASAAASSDCAAGTTVVKITSATAMVANDNIVFTSGTIEWVRSVSVSGTASFTVQDATTYGHVSATGIFNGAEHFVFSLNVEGVTRGRVVINNNASSDTQPIVSRIACITEA